jgi:hypothetical protein
MEDYNSQVHRSHVNSIGKKLKKEIFLAKKKLFIDSFKHCHDSGSFWKALNFLSGRSFKDEIPSLRNPDGSEVTSNEEKSEVLVQQFASIFNTEDTEVLDELEDNQCFVTEVLPGNLFKKISSLSNRTSAGQDGLSVRVLKNCALILIPCLVVITNRCLMEECYPSSWKEAVVTPVPKVKSSSNPSDYRPISLLSIFSKIVESLINDIVLQFIEPQLSNTQFGFLYNTNLG